MSVYCILRLVGMGSFPALSVLLTICSVTVQSAAAAGSTHASSGAGNSQVGGRSGSVTSAEWQNAKKAADAVARGGNSTEAEGKYRSALTSAEKSKDNKAIVACLTALANCLAAQDNKLDEEEPLRMKACELAAKTYGATSPQYAMQLAELADVQARKGETAQTEESVSRAGELLGHSDEKYPLEMATCYQAIGEQQILAGTPALADDSFKKALDLRTAKLAPDDLAVLDTCRRYADVLKQLGRADDAKKLQERINAAKSDSGSASPPAIGASSATKTSSAVDGEKAHHAKADGSRAALAKLVNDAKDADKGGDREKSVAAWKAVVENAEKTGASDGLLPYALVHLGDANALLKKSDEAAAAYRRGLSLRENGDKESKETLGMARNLCRVAGIEMQSKNSNEAERLYLKAIDLQDQLKAPDSLLAQTMANAISACMMSKDNAKVEQVCTRLTPIAEKEGGTVGQIHKRTAVAMLGSVYMKSGRMNEGMQLFKSMSKAHATDQKEMTQAMQDSNAANDALVDAAEEAAFLK